MSSTSDQIAKLLEDPESIKLISELAESFIGSSANKDLIPDTITNNEEITNENQNITSISVIAEHLERTFSQKDVENAINLITALKPYMSKKRQGSADSIMQVLNMLKFVSRSNLSEMGKLFSILNK